MISHFADFRARKKTLIITLLLQVFITIKGVWKKQSITSEENGTDVLLLIFIGPMQWLKRCFGSIHLLAALTYQFEDIIMTSCILNDKKLLKFKTVMLHTCTCSC